MKCTTIIDRKRDEEVIIYAKERSRFVERIEAAVVGDNPPLVGYTEGEIVPIDISQVNRFTTEGGKLYAVLDGKVLRIHGTLGGVEELLGDGFVRINQSCIANVKKIARFEVTLGAGLAVKFKDGGCDYVSRRQMKKVKERIGFKL